MPGIFIKSTYIIEKHIYRQNKSFRNITFISTPFNNNIPTSNFKLG